MTRMGNIALSFAGISTQPTKDSAAAALAAELRKLGIRMLTASLDKPWGIECKIVESDTRAFLGAFFTKEELPSSVVSEPYGPKILIIGPSHRLSWHVHERKDAFLKVLHGEALVYTSSTDEQPAAPSSHIVQGGLAHVPERIRHRLEGAGAGVIIAEISRNVFPDHPSDDADERRISDDYGRK